MPPPKPPRFRISRRKFLSHLSLYLISCIQSFKLLTATAAPLEIDTKKEVLGNYLDILIPEDISPSASQAGIVDTVDAWWRRNSYSVDTYQQSMLELDTQSRQIYKNSFIALSTEQRESMIERTSELSYDEAGRYFFEETRRIAFHYYYSKDANWRQLAIERPPQPQGYLMFDKKPKHQ